MSDDITDRNVERLLAAPRDGAVEPSPEFVAALAARLGTAVPAASAEAPLRRAGFWPWLIPLAAAAAVLATFALRPPPFAAVVKGTLADAAGHELVAGGDVPTEAPLVARTAAVLAVGRNARVEVDPGASVTLLASDDVKQAAGAARYAVRDGGRLRIETPRGTLEAGASSFIIRVEGGNMQSQAMKMAAVAAVTAAVVGGGVIAWHWNTPDGRQGTIAIGPGETARVPSGSGADVGASRTLDGEALAAATSRNADLSAENARLRQQLRNGEAELAQLRAAVKATAEKKGVTIAAVLSRIDELKKNGLKSLLDAVTTSQLVSDLKALGAEGTTAMLGMLKSQDENERFLAARLLENLGDPAAVPGLMDAALHDPSTMVANMASHALMLAPGGEALAACQKIYAEATGDGARLNALFGMATHDDPRGIDLSLDYIRNTKNSADYRAALVSGFIVSGEERYLPLIDAALESMPSDKMSMAAVNYFKGLKSDAGRAHLQQLADDPKSSPELKAAALAALK